MNYELKRMKENDLEISMNWRMRDDIAAMMFSDVKLSLDGQKKWYEKIKNDNTQIRWIIYADSVPIGSMYFTDINYLNKRCESGWFIAEKGYRSLQLAMALQQNSLDFAFNILKLNRVYGYVIDDNIHVVRLLKLCGFNEEGVFREHVFKNGKLHDVYCVGQIKKNWDEIKFKYTYPYIPFEE